MEQLYKIQRPTEISDQSLVFDLVTSSPDPDVRGWDQPWRNSELAFGEDTVNEFIQMSGLKLICRSHQIVEGGYEFFASRQLVSPGC